MKEQTNRDKTIIRTSIIGILANVYQMTPYIREEIKDMK